MWIPDVKKNFPYKMPPLLLVENNKQIRDSIPIIEDSDFSFTEFFKVLRKKEKK